MTAAAESGTRAVLFDLDGTFADTAPDMALALNQVRAAHQLPALPLSALRPHVSRGARGMLEIGFGIAPEEARYEALRDAFLDYYSRNICVETKLFSGIENVLRTLEQRGIAWGIVTNKAARFTLPLLRALGMAERAACIVCGDTTPFSKPHPQPLLEAALRLAIAPGSAIYVGDDERDIVAARAARMRSLVVRYGYLGDGTSPEEWGADALIDAPGEILDHL
jgi:phosphoglycolate phosphatase